MGGKKAGRPFECCACVSGFVRGHVSSEGECLLQVSFILWCIDETQRLVRKQFQVFAKHFCASCTG